MLLFSSPLLFALRATAEPLADNLPTLDAQRDVAPSILKSGTQMRAVVRIYCEDKRVRLTWTYSPAGAFPPESPSTTQDVAVGFWPTAAEAVGDNKLLVAGLERSGATRIELWTTRAPLVLQPLDGTGGDIQLRPQGLTNIDVLYSDQVIGRKVVRALIRCRGIADSAFVHFQDSRDLYRIAWSGTLPTLTLALAATAEPALQRTFDSYQGGDHITEGYVYVFSNAEDLSLTPWLVLTDSNRDGTIDQRETLTPAEYVARGLQDRLQYSEYAGF